MDDVDVRVALTFLVFATVVPASAAATDVSGTLTFGRDNDTGAVTREADVSTRFQLGGAADLTARLDFGLTSAGDQDAAYASAGIANQFGSIDIGLPRSILETGPLPDPARFNASTARGTFRPLAAEIALDQGLTAGVSVLAERGPFQIGTSYHTVDEDGDPVLGVAGRYNAPVGTTEDIVSIYGGVESDGTVERYRLGTEVSLGRALASVDFLRTDDDGPSASQISLGLEVTDTITLGVTGMRERSDGLVDPESRVGVGASMSLDSGTFLRGGVDTRSSDDYAVDVEIGFQF